MKQIAILVPVLGRPHRVALFCDSFEASGARGAAEVYFIAQEGDHAQIAAVETEHLAGRCRLLVVPASSQSWAKKINAGYEASIEPWMLLAGDDIAFHGGWVDALTPHMREGVGVIGTRSAPATRREIRNSRGPAFASSSPHPLVSRAYVDAFGTIDEAGKVVHDGYHHNFPDTELCATAVKRGLYAYADDCILEHMHPLHGRGVDDEIYRLGRCRIEVDRARFAERALRFGLQQ